MRRLVPLLGCALLVLICVARATNATTSFVYLADLQLDPQYDAASPVRAVVLRSRRSSTSEAAGDRSRRRLHPILTTPYHTQPAQYCHTNSSNTCSGNTNVPFASNNDNSLGQYGCDSPAALLTSLYVLRWARGSECADALGTAEAESHSWVCQVCGSERGTPRRCVRALAQRRLSDTSALAAREQ